MSKRLLDRPIDVTMVDGTTYTVERIEARDIFELEETRGRSIGHLLYDPSKRIGDLGFVAWTSLRRDGRVKDEFPDFMANLARIGWHVGFDLDDDGGENEDDDDEEVDPASADTASPTTEPQDSSTHSPVGAA